MSLTQDEVARPSIDLDPFTAPVGQPLEASVLEHVDLVGPSETAFFVAENIVVLFTKLVSSFQDEQTAIIRAVRQEIDEPLHAAKATTFRILKQYILADRNCR